MDVDQLSHYLSHGIALIPTVVDPDTGSVRGAFKNWNAPDAPGRITEYDHLYNHVEGGSTWFLIVPGHWGLFVVDIDRKGGKDGLVSLRTLCHDIGISIPSWLRDPSTHPCHVVTPSGGLHLYFRSSIPLRGGALSYRKKKYPGVDCLSDRHGCGAAGGEKPNRPGKTYEMVGSLDAVPELPLIWRDVFARPVYDRPLVPPVYHEQLTIEQIIERMTVQGTYSIDPGDRNNTLYRIAARSAQHGIAEEHVKAWAADTMSDHDDRAKTIHSAYRRYGV